MRQASAMLHQSPYVNQLVCAVGGVLVFVAKSEWRGGDQKKMEKVEFDMPTTKLPHLLLVETKRLMIEHVLTHET